jgi:hypothetical protein
MSEKRLEKKSLSSPDQTMSFDLGKFEVVTIGGLKFGRATFQPGWKWSTSVKPLAKTDSCQAHHIGYMISGSLEVTLNGGKTDTFNTGDSFDIPPGHDGKVVGSTPVVYIDFIGAADNAKSK